MSLSLWLTASLVFAGPQFEVTAVDERPARAPSAELDEEIDSLREAVADEPKERKHRFALVRALIDAGELDDALVAARDWREVDAYNLVVVRLIGDILSELDRPGEALRTYSAVTELLSEDPEAQRALATVLEAQGQLDAAYERLEVALSLRPEDQRLSFELADVALRLGKLDEASARLEAIAADEAAPEALRYPAKQRLAQVYAKRRRAAKGEAERGQWAAKIAELELRGASQNDIKVYLSWDTDRTDVDLWVTNPRGEKVYYNHKRGKFGGQLLDDVTTGYGPESYTAQTATAGTYAVEVNYFGDGGAMKEARGEVLVIVNEGSDEEEQFSFPYVLPRRGDTVRVAEIEVKK